MEGRDIGTVVFPDAEVKIYLDATLDERARRRYEELRKKGERVTLDGVRQALEQRDRRDSTRAHSPLRPADDSTAIDTTSMSVKQVVGEILKRVPR
jgi:cytidylate kinase